MYLQLNNITKSYGLKTVLKNLNIELHDGDIIGIIGDNGEGKSTLLKIISNEVIPDSGSVTISPNDIKLGYHEQYIPLKNLNQTIENYVMSLSPNLFQLYIDINNLINKTDQLSIDRMISLQSEFNEKGGYEILGNIDNYLNKLGLIGITSDTNISSLSGGQKTRLQFIQLLFQNPDILLFDEPTNHLDADSLDWLKSYVLHKKGIILIVSHDRAFLNDVTNKIFEMEKGKYILYSGNFDSYKMQKASKEANDLLMYKAKMKEVNRLSKEANKKLSEAKSTDKKFIRGWSGPPIRKKAGKKSKTAQILLKRIETQIKEKTPDKPIKKDSIKIDLQLSEKSSQLICKLENIDFGYKSKIFINNLNLEIWQKDRIAITGSNGSGKSTLLKIINNELAPVSGNRKIGENVKIGYFSQEHEILDEYNSVLEEFRKNINMTEEESRTFLYKFLFSGNQVFQKINTLSQGEKAKLVLAILLNVKANFLILDEPTNHLDLSSRELLEQALEKYEGTLCVVSHDKYFLDRIKINKYYNL